MENITYKRVWINITAKFVTHCPYRKGLLVGSHSCFFCAFCHGRTEDLVSCSFRDFYKAPEPKKVVVSMDVMVKGEFRRTIRMNLVSKLDIAFRGFPTKDAIDRAVEKYCPFVYKHEKWNVEFNYK